MALPRHKRDAHARPKRRAAIVAGPLAVLATASVVTLGVLAADPAQREVLAQQASDAVDSVNRDSLAVSRSGSRKAPADAAETSRKTGLMSRSAVRAAAKGADEKRWTTSELNIWSAAGKKAKMLGELERGVKVLVTGRAAKSRVEIALMGKSRWVTAGYLTKEEPPSLGGPCTNGSWVPSGVSRNIASVHQAVCAAFPSITSYGTFRGGGGDHSSGRAIDIMVSGSLGWAVANFVREHYSVLGVSYVIYSQNIWSVERGGEGWRGMASRGSTTANHYDHVHVSTF